MNSANDALVNSAKPPLYSARVIRVFSILFSAVAGGALTAQNLQTVGLTNEANKALWGSIGYTVLLLFVSSFLPTNFGGSWLGLLIGYIGAMGLEQYFKQFVDRWEDFPTRNFTKPLLICIAVFVPIIALVIYSLQLK